MEIDGETVETVADFIFSGLQNRKGVCQGCILSPCLFNSCIMGNAGLDKAQFVIKISGRNINNLRYADKPPYGRK